MMRRNRFVRVPKPWWVRAKLDFVQGDMVKICRKPDQVREVLHAEWHYERKEWTYIVHEYEEWRFGFETKFSRNQLVKVEGDRSR